MNLFRRKNRNRKNNSKTARRIRKKRTQNSAEYGTLEPRKMFAPVVHYNANIDTVYIFGTNANDAAVVQIENSQVKVRTQEGNQPIRNWFVNGPVNQVRYYGRSGNDYFRNDTYIATWAHGEYGHDTLLGGYGDDIIHGGGHNDVIYGRSGNDRLYDNEGADKIYGGSGNDILSSGMHNDVLGGGSGNDTIYGGDGNDNINGDSGNDFIYAGNGHDIARGSSGNDRVYGQDGNDRLWGDYGNDYLYGGNHSDDLFGGGGADVLYGQAGMDGLFGGMGVRDSLIGGTGADRLLIGNEDVIYQYESSRDAHIYIRNNIRNWTDYEVERVDLGLKAIHWTTGSTRLLKDNNAADPYVFYRDGSGGSVAYNVNATHDIHFEDGTFTSSNTFVAQVVIHEIGHTWDEQSENPYINGFRSYSWTYYNGQWYQNGNNDFARPRGKDNPYEDFATVFANVIMKRAGLAYSGQSTGQFYSWNNGGSIWPNKALVVNNFINWRSAN